MDNLFDYIIILFFIISAIASMFKSKKKEEAKKESQAKSRTSSGTPQRMEAVKSGYQSIESAAVNTERRKVPDPFEEKDIYSDREKGNWGSDQKKRGYSLNQLKSEVDRYFEEALLKSQIGQTETETETPEPVTPIITEHKSDAVPVSSFQTSSIVDIQREKAKGINRRAQDIRRRIKDKRELRDLIVINEILGKPKALKK